MTYWALNAVFLLAALTVGTAAGIRLKHKERTVALAAAGGAAAVVLVLTAVFDNLMIAAGLFTYAPAMISGMMLGLAPLGEEHAEKVDICLAGSDVAASEITWDGAAAVFRRTLTGPRPVAARL